MRKHALLIVILLSIGLMAASYQSRTVTQTWKFQADDALSYFEPISGKWSITTPASLKEPLLSQSIKYADFPKILTKDSFYDFTASTRLYISNDSTDVQSGGMVFRYRNLFSYYLLFVNAKDKRVTLTRASLGGIKALKRQNLPIESNRWYNLKVHCYLDQIKVSLDDQPVIEYKDDTSTGGRVGLVTAGTSVVYFRELIVDNESVETVTKK